MQTCSLSFIQKSSERKYGYLNLSPYVLGTQNFSSGNVVYDKRPLNIFHLMFLLPSHIFPPLVTATD